MDKDRIVRWIGHVNEGNLEQALKEIQRLLKLNAKKPIFLLLKSSGGEVESGFAFYDAIQILKPNLITVGMGNIDSAAPLILDAGVLRIATPHTSFYLHNPATFIQDATSIDEKKLRAYAEDLRKGSENYSKILVAHSKGKLTTRTLHHLMNRNAYLTSEEAWKLGFVDVISEDGLIPEL